MSLTLKSIFLKTTSLGRRFIGSSSNYLHVKQSEEEKLIGNVQGKMCGWQIHAYGDLAEELQFSDKIKMPSINDANHVLIKVEASSINPIDILMTSIYIFIKIIAICNKCS